MVNLLQTRLFKRPTRDFDGKNFDVEKIRCPKKEEEQPNHLYLWRKILQNVCYKILIKIEHHFQPEHNFGKIHHLKYDTTISSGKSGFKNIHL